MRRQSLPALLALLACAVCAVDAHTMLGAADAGGLDILGGTSSTERSLLTKRKSQNRPGDDADDVLAGDGSMPPRGSGPEGAPMRGPMLGDGALAEDGAMPPRGPADAPMPGSLARRYHGGPAPEGAPMRGPMPEGGALAGDGSMPPRGPGQAGAPMRGPMLGDGALAGDGAMPPRGPGPAGAPMRGPMPDDGALAGDGAMPPRGPGPAGAPMPGNAQCQTLLNLVEGDEDLGMFRTALETANVGPELASMSADVTVFAPSGSAFAAVPEEAQRELMEDTDPGVLAELLGLHIVMGRYHSQDLAEGEMLETISGSSLQVAVSADGSKTLQAPSGVVATITSGDVDACNGVLHVIDAVLVPAIPDDAAGNFDEEPDPAVPPTQSGDSSPPTNCGGLGQSICPDGTCTAPYGPVNMGGVSTICRTPEEVAAQT